MKLNFKVFGQGTPVVILHGLLGMLDNWKSFGKRLADDYMVYLVDLRNHGRSPHAADMTYNDMANDVIQFMDDQWLLSEVNILGHSMGGKVAMQVAIEEPDRLGHLIVVDIAPKGYKPSHDQILSALKAAKLPQNCSRKDIENLLARELDDPQIIAFLMKNVTRVDAGLDWRVNLESILKNYTNILGNVRARQRPAYNGSTVFYRGENSDYIQDDDLTAILDFFPAAKIVDVPDAGHWIHVDNGTFLLEAVRSELSK